MGDGAFHGCALESLDIPASLEVIGENSFADNVHLCRPNLPPISKLKEIGGSAFQNCSRLGAIILPPGVQKLGIECFESCTALT
jgi:hypothetical protein